MTEIYLIRHAQAEGNLYRMMQGHWDGDITQMGREQIEALAKRFENVHIDAVYSSDLYRTRMTAQAVARHGNLPVNCLQALREINMGPWEAQFFGNVLHDDPERAWLFIHDPEKWHLPGAETYQQVGDRALPCLEQLAKKHDGQSIAVVSHGVTIRCLLSRISGIPLSDSQQLPIGKNTAVSKLLWDNGSFKVEYMNDYSHIVPLGVSSWSRVPELRHETFDPELEPDYYTACYQDAWLAAHGSLEGFCARSYLDSAIEHHRADNQALLRMYLKDEPAGLVELDTLRGLNAGYGWISLFYLVPELRNQGYGIQLLGRAIAKYKALGRRSLRLTVAEENKAAIAFYSKNGFKTLSEQSGCSGKLLLMERKLEAQHG